MKKISILLALAMLVMLFAACSPASDDQPAADPPANTTESETTQNTETDPDDADVSEPADSETSDGTYDLTGKKIGVTFYDLTNPIWAATGEKLVELGTEMGAEVTLVSCDGNAATQVSQVENMIANSMDLIIIGPQDANAMTNVVKQAHDAGIKVMSYGQSMEGVDSQYVVENYEAGYIVGTKAGEWINEKLGGEAVVGLLDYPLMEDIIDRANGIKDGLAETCPGAEIVATASSADAVTGMAAVENFLQAHPDMKVVVCIGDGGAIGANEAVKAAGLATDDFGIFSCDATAEALSALMNNEPIRMTVGLGTPTQKAGQTIDLAARMILGEDYDHDEYTPIDPVDSSNVEQYWEDAGY